MFKLPREPEIRQMPLYDATYYRSSCHQDKNGEYLIRNHIPAFPQANFSEDCLYLNIFTPNVIFLNKEFNVYNLYKILVLC
jgi:carboxylesterase type B